MQTNRFESQFIIKCWPLVILTFSIVKKNILPSNISFLLKLWKQIRPLSTNTWQKHLRQAVMQRLSNQTLSCLLSTSDHLEVKVNLTALSMKCPPREWVMPWQEQPEGGWNQAIAKAKGRQAKVWSKGHKRMICVPHPGQIYFVWPAQCFSKYQINSWP